MKKPFVLGLLLVLLASIFVAAQEKPQAAAAPHVAKYLWISHGTMNPGKGMVYANLVKQIKESAIANNADIYWLAGHNITGNGREVSFVTFHNDLASVDKTISTMQQVERAAMVKNANLSAESAEAEGPMDNSVLAKYREDLSFDPMKVDAAHATRWLVETMELKPGTMMEAEDLIKQELDLVKKGNIDEHWLTYQVMAGGPGSTLLFVVPLRTLADLDAMEKQSQAEKVVFTDPVRRHFASIIKTIALRTHTDLIAVSPEMSRPPQTLVAENPTFWTVKEEAPVVAAKAKKVKKAPVEPAAIKEEKKK